MFHVSKTERAIHIDDEIGRESTGRIGNETIVKGLDQLGSGPVTIRLSTPGGDLLEGLKMLESLRRHQGQITVSCDAVVASAGTLFLCVPEWIREASANAEVMIHRTSSAQIGNCLDMRNMADILEKYDRKLAGMYSAVTDLSEDELLEKMTAETYFSAAEAAAIGFIDRIVGAAVDAKKFPRLAAASATAKRHAMSKPMQSAVAAKADSQPPGWSKVDRMARAIGIARQSEQRKKYERKLAIATEAIRYGLDPQEALRNAR
jgi:ATP-dependent protease ClpP protease subunit